MIVEIGHIMLIGAFCVALLASFLPVIGWRRGDFALMQSADILALSQFVLILTSFFALLYSYVQSDFSVFTVWQNSHSAQPMIYKITGVWGNHEGSMLLWVLILALFGASLPLYGRGLPVDLRALVIAVQSWICVAFLAFIILTSNPFARLTPAPLEGRDLNPVLQDIGLAIHPPLLYVGYVGFSLTFAFAVAALLLGRLDEIWARWVRPFALAAWMFLTLGIAMGSYWAYYELGWGGWWFWDPVENASLMPWLAGTAFLHSAIVLEKRGTLKVWTVLLAILTFSLSLLGTFLVRSGVLTSVHSFASDPARGVFILCIMVLFTGGSLTLFAWRGRRLTGREFFSPISREGALLLNNMLLAALCGIVLVGTLYPLAYEALLGIKISVGPPVFNSTTLPLFVLLLIALPFGTYLNWKRADFWGVLQRLFGAFALCFMCAFIVFLFSDDKASLAPLGLLLGFWLVVGALYEPLWRAKIGQIPLTASLRRLVRIPHASWGATLGHAGMGVTVLGIVCVSAWEQEIVETARPGEEITLDAYTFTYQGIRTQSDANFTAEIASFDVARKGKTLKRIDSSKRLYMARQMPTTEAGIVALGLSHLYVSLGDIDTEDGVRVRLYWKPFITLIWGGAILMFCGGLLSLLDRRLRIALPYRNRE